MTKTCTNEQCSSDSNVASWEEDIIIYPYKYTQLDWFDGATSNRATAKQQAVDRSSTVALNLLTRAPASSLVVIYIIYKYKEDIY